MRGISDLLASDMEESTNFIDENSIISSESDASSLAPSKQKSSQSKKLAKKRHRVTMPKSKSRVTKSSPVAAAKSASTKVTGAKRKALEEHVNGQATTVRPVHRDSEDEKGASLSSEEQEDERKPKSKAVRGPKATAKAEVVLDKMDTDQSPAAAQSSHAQIKGKTAKVIMKKAPPPKAKQAKQVPRTAVPDPQPEPVEMETEEEEEASERITRPQPKIFSRQNSRVRQEPDFRRRAGSASDTERGDPNLRRKLGDLTRKFENIDLKYRNLKDIGISEATANMEKLRGQCEATTQASNELIASLKKELATQAPLAQDARKLKKELQMKESETSSLRTTAAELGDALAAAQNEIKALQAKLVASRSASVAIESAGSKTPASALKSNGPTRTVMVGSAEAVQAAQAAQLKEDLYSDLTGLIVRSVKRTEEGDTYDCIQTGRNGTLHFKLSVCQEVDGKQASFEETEFLYTPLLDSNRDRDMIELLPDYLTEDITFARQHAARFYSRVADTLTKRMTED